MHSSGWKTGIIALCIVLLHCVNELPSTVHLILNLEAVTQNDSTRVMITTSVPQEYSYYRVVDEVCTLIVTYRKLINNSIDSTFIIPYPVLNDSASSLAGTFNGFWDVPDSLSFDKLYPNSSMFVNASIFDETGHAINNLLIMQKDTAVTALCR